MEEIVSSNIQTTGSGDNMTVCMVNFMTLYGSSL